MVNGSMARSFTVHAVELFAIRDSTVSCHMNTCTLSAFCNVQACLCIVVPG